MPRVPEEPRELISDVSTVALDGIRRSAADTGESEDGESLDQDFGPIVERAQQNKDGIASIPEDEEPNIVNLEVAD